MKAALWQESLAAAETLGRCPRERNSSPLPELPCSVGWSFWEGLNGLRGGKESLSLKHFRLPFTSPFPPHVSVTFTEKALIIIFHIGNKFFNAPQTPALSPQNSQRQNVHSLEAADLLLSFLIHSSGSLLWGFLDLFHATWMPLFWPAQVCGSHPGTKEVDTLVIYLWWELDLPKNPTSFYNLCSVIYVCPIAFFKSLKVLFKNHLHGSENFICLLSWLKKSFFVWSRLSLP